MNNTKNLLIANMITRLQQRDKIYCHNCGKQIWADSDTCPHCNASIIKQSDNSNISSETSSETKPTQSTLSILGNKLLNCIGSLFACALFCIIGGWFPKIVSEEDAGAIAITMIAGDHQGKLLGPDIDLPKKSSIDPFGMKLNSELKRTTGLTLDKYQRIMEQPPGLTINSCGIMIYIGSKYLVLFRTDLLFDFYIVQLILLILAIFSLGEFFVNIWLLLR